MYQMYLERQKRRYLGTRSARIKTLSIVAFASFFLFIFGLLCVAVLFAWYAKDLPRPDKVQRKDGLSTVILDRNGEKLYDIFEDANRIPAKWEEVPQCLRDATVAIEDKDFYKHQGLSTTGILRALIRTILYRDTQGGSTLTQQLVKNVLLSTEQTLPRKMKEAILSIQIERKYSKNDILLMYLNEVPYGGTAIGVKAAAEHYFNKDVKNLSMPECVILAGLPQSPTTYSPFTGDPKAYIGRTTQVLRRMREDSYISVVSEGEIRKALDGVIFASGEDNLRAPHFVAYVKNLLIEKFGKKAIETGGMKVTTTLDWKLQEASQIAVKEEVDKAKNLKVSNGAAVVLDPHTGEILTMVGSKDYSATDSSGFKFNVVTQGLRQPGSTIKPILYAAAFSKGYTPSTLLLDVDTKYPSGDISKPEYNPKNYDSKYRGPIQLRFALANSINTIAVKTTALTGVKDVLTTAYAMGLKTLEPTNDNLKRLGLSLALGGGEVYMLDLASAFGVFATGGLRVDPVAILKVENSSGKIIFEQKPVSPREELDPSVAFLISAILSDNESRKEVFGLKSHLFIPGKTVAAKTGTTDDKRDNWTAGYTPKRVAVTWVGNNDNSPMHPSLASGITGAAPIWNRIMRQALKNLPDENFTKPEHIIEMEIDAYGGGTVVDGQPSRQEFFIKGTEPTAPSSIYQKLKISRKEGNKLANSVEIATGDYDEKLFIVFSEEDPVSTDGKNRWQEGINGWIGGQEGKYRPPTEVYTGTDQIVLNIKKPRDLDTIDDNNVTLEIEIFATADIERVEIFIDGEKKKERQDKSFTETISIPTGSHTIHVKAADKRGKTTERAVRVGVKEAFSTPTPSPIP